MIITKLYKYDSSQEANGYKGEDFSKYVMLADSDADDLTQILDVVELTLAGLPISEEFAPSTRFIYQKLQGEITDIHGNVTGYEFTREWHLSVAEDIVSQPIMSDNQYFDHHITFNEASVLSQKRPVDNISVTYKLKDVDLESEKIIGTEKASVKIVNADTWKPERNFGYYFIPGRSHYLGKRFYWTFPNWYSDTSLNSTRADWENIPYNRIIPTGQTEEITIPIPMLQYYEGDTGDFEFAFGTKNYKFGGYCSVLVNVYETDRSTEETTLLRTIEVNPALSVEREAGWLISPILSNEPDDPGVQATHRGVVVNRTFMPQYNPTSGIWKKRIAKFEDNPTNRKINITLRPNKKYRITCTLNDLTSTETGNLWDNAFPVAEHSFYLSVQDGENNNPDIVRITNTNLFAELIFFTENEGDFKAEFHEAPPMNAYDLYQKAQINSQNIKKIDGVPINETPMTFYCNEDDILELQNTQIVEAFYNQKNLWELQLEIGKYIHAIPENRFGKDDRLVTHWRRLGRPDILTDNATTVSIFNSRSIENYIAACSSYVNNMVQLGGEIDEWIAPKSTSEEYLVSNDVAELITSKNIIEIIDLEVKTITGELKESKDNAPLYSIGANEVRNLTGRPYAQESRNGYVFEKNIYNLLPITANEYINKGLAIYYELGTNVIKGFNYRLPTESAGDIENEYAIKRILGHAYGVPQGLWQYIKVNDFLFHIRYRTKENIRSEQTRPDLRKYLLNSKYDQIPQHKQFNNQTDILVDSVKFGNNVYGKLIKTGNTEYTVVEWVENLADIKQSGDLYNIRGNLYYVSKVKNTYYKTYVISEVTYSKDYNQLSEIIGIPSEPRFYEISEQSLIERDFAYNKYLMLSTDLKNTMTHKFTLQHPPDSVYDIQEDYWQTIMPVDPDSASLYVYMTNRSFISKVEYNGQELTSYSCSVANENGDRRCIVLSSELNMLAGDNTEIELTFTINPNDNLAYTSEDYRRKVNNQFNTYIKGLLFEGVDYFPKYAITTFKNDNDRKYGEVPGNERFLIDVCTPIGTFSQQNTLTMSWDMVDNFSAGDYVSETVFGFTTEYYDDPINNAYRTLKPVKYTDVYGRSDLVDFAILNNIDFTNDNILNLPNSPVRTKEKYVNQYRGTYEFNAVPTIAELNTKLRNADGEYSIYEDNGQLVEEDRARPVAHVYDGNWFEVKIITGDVVTATYIYTYEGDGYDTNGEFIGEWVITLKTQEYTNYFNKPSILDNTYSDQVIFSTSNLEKNGLNTSGIGLLKDNREKININFNVQMLTDSDRFVLSSYLWQPGKQGVKLALLNAEINKISTDTIPTNNIIRSIDLPISDILSITYEPLNTIRIGISTALSDVDLTGVKAICLIATRSINESPELTKFVMGRNITGLTEADAKKDWYIRPITDSDIRKQ